MVCRERQTEWLARLIQDEIKRPLSSEVLFGALEHGGRVLVDLVDGKLAFQFSPPALPPPAETLH